MGYIEKVISLFKYLSEVWKITMNSKNLAEDRKPEEKQCWKTEVI
jgi:hypothetical protein